MTRKTSLFWSWPFVTIQVFHTRVIIWRLLNVMTGCDCPKAKRPFYHSFCENIQKMITWQENEFLHGFQFFFSNCWICCWYFGLHFSFINAIHNKACMFFFVMVPILKTLQLKGTVYFWKSKKTSKILNIHTESLNIKVRW